MKPERIAELAGKVDSERARNSARKYPDKYPPQMEIPVKRYVDAHFHELESQYLWSKVWLLAGHVDELPEVGCFKKWDFSGVPVILVRGKDRLIRAFFNSCRHRGAALVHEDKGRVNVLACKFHAWTYDLEGSLALVPERHDFPCLDPNNNSLVQLRCELWANLIFVNRNPQAPPLSEYLGRAVNELAHFDLHLRRSRRRTAYELKCNWKIAMDAFLEAYHVDTVHPKTVAPYLDSRGVVFEMWGRTTLMVLPNHLNTDFPYLTADSGDARHELTRSTSLNFEVFPNFHAPLTEFTFPIMLFWPTDVNTCKIEVLYLDAPNNPISQDQMEEAVYQQVDNVLREDFSNVEAQQRTYLSAPFDKINIGLREWRIYRWHEMIDEIIGPENIPEDLRLPVLVGPETSG